MSLPIFCVCAFFALASNAVSGENSGELNPTMKSFSDALQEKMYRIEEIKSQLEEQRQRNNGFVVSLLSEFTYELYNYRQGFGNAENKMIEYYARHAYDGDVKRNDSQNCFEFVKHIPEVGRRSMDNAEACFNKALSTGLGYLRSVERWIKYGLNTINHGIESFLHQNGITNDFSTVTNLETYLLAERTSTSTLKSAIEVELKTSPQITLMWSKFQHWYNDHIRSRDLDACREENSYENVQNFLHLSHGHAMCCLTKDNKFCLPYDSKASQ